MVWSISACIDDRLILFFVRGNDTYGIRTCSVSFAITTDQRRTTTENRPLYSRESYSGRSISAWSAYSGQERKR